MAKMPSQRERLSTTSTPATRRGLCCFPWSRAFGPPSPFWRSSFLPSRTVPSAGSWQPGEDAGKGSSRMRAGETRRRRDTQIAPPTAGIVVRRLRCFRHHEIEHTFQTGDIQQFDQTGTAAYQLDLAFRHMVDDPHELGEPC